MVVCQFDILVLLCFVIVFWGFSCFVALGLCCFFQLYLVLRVVLVLVVGGFYT